MNLTILASIERILSGQKPTYTKAELLAKEFGVEDGDILSSILLENPDILNQLPDLQGLTIGKLRQITLIAIVRHQEKSPEVNNAIAYIISAYEKMLDRGNEGLHPSQQIKIYDHYIIATLLWLTGKDKPTRACPRCPVRKE